MCPTGDNGGLRFLNGEIEMTSEQPGQGASPDQGEPAPKPAPEWTTPPPPSSSGVGPSTGDPSGAPQQPAAPQWSQPAPPPDWGGQQQPAPQAPAWNAAPQQPGPPQQPAPQPGWGQQPAPQPGPYVAPQPAPQPGWAQQPQPTPQQGWSQQPAPQPGPYVAPQQPAPQQGWSQQPPPMQQQPQPQGQWAAPAVGAAAYGAPPPQGPAAQPGWGAPGQPQPGWQGGPPPAKSGGNGCLKACLIVGVILVVLAIIAVIALFAVGSSFVGGLGVDSNGNLKDCSIVTSSQLKSVLGSDTEAHPLSGLANTAIGATLDKRVLPDADNCYIISGAGQTTTQASGGYGRIAKYSNGDAGSVFDKEKSSAQSGQYFAVDVPGAGDQAFCTGWSDKYPATGALVRKGNDLIYVSLLIGTDFGNLNLNQASSDTGVPYSPDACTQAVSIAKLALH